jgi:flagellar biosynthesis protein
VNDEQDTSAPDIQNQAVALRYLAGDFAPKVIAKGRGFVAEEIIKYAKEHGVFIHESEDLVSLLMQVDFDRHIPVELYRTIAEILAWLYALENKESSFS